MLSKCANPGCTATFLYLRQGKLFRLNVGDDISVSSSLPPKTKTATHIEFFWLCSQCATELTIDYDRGTGVAVLPLAKPATRAAAASRM